MEWCKLDDDNVSAVDIKDVLQEQQVFVCVRRYSQAREQALLCFAECVAHVRVELDSTRARGKPLALPRAK